MLTSIDLFSGPGGLCTGFKAAGIKPLIAVEWSYWTAQTYAATHNADILPLYDYLSEPESFSDLFRPSSNTLLILGDINQVRASLILEILNKRFNCNSVDVVSGGAPCESFSMAGQRKEDDERNQLFQNIPRIAKAVNAKIILFENVKGLFSKKYNNVTGEMYNYVCDYFEKDTGEGITYHLVTREKKCVLLKASDYGVPQNRERVFLVGINNAYPDIVFNYPEKTNGPDTDCPYVSVSDAILDLPVVNSGEEGKKYTYKRQESEPPQRKRYLDWVRGKIYSPEKKNLNIIDSHLAPGHLPRIIERFKLIKIGENQKTAYERLFEDDPNCSELQYFTSTLYGARNRRLNPNEPSFTVTSHCLDEMVHPFLDRAMTPREIARLQSFPDWYKFKGPYVRFHGDKEQDRYEQIGDAIPPLLAYALAKAIVKALSLEEK